ncbi:MAG: PAS domain S-box protein [Paracoccaceae bacterium]
MGRASEHPVPRTLSWGAAHGPARRRVDLLSLIPLVSILALVGLVAALVWLVARSEAEQSRTKLATDALWVEQTLRFQLSIDEDMLARLALDQTGGSDLATLQARARLHIASNPEVLSVVWHDQQGRAITAVPGLPSAEDGALADVLTRSGAISTRPVYGAVQPDGRVTMAIRAAEGAGVVSITLSMPLMLERHVPWWIAEQYGVELMDSGGTVLAQRIRREPGAGQGPHAISFDPPLSGTVLRITPYAAPGGQANILLLSAIGGLAAFAVLALLALYRNGQRRRQAEAQLLGEMAFRRSMEDSLTVGLRAKDHSGRILYVNSAFARLVGWSGDELVGQTGPMPYWAPDRLQETIERHRKLAEGGAVAQSFETRFRRRDGSEIDVQVYEAPLIDATGAHRGWMGSVIDITEAKRAQRLARAQDESMARTGRLVTLGEMASTLAHELNQPLGAIASYAAGSLNLLEQGKTDPAVLRAVMEKLNQQATRAGQIIRRIQDLVRKREPRFARLDLAEVIAETVGFLAADARENRVRIETAISPAPPVEADPILLQQVLVNLIRNGMEAMAGPARSGDVLAIRLASGPQGGARLEVQDCGPGIAPEVADKLFDPFTSTKPQGMGIGLNICRTIVELHRGQLTHRPAPDGRGTVFCVDLPAAEQAEAAAE